MCLLDVILSPYNALTQTGGTLEFNCTLIGFPSHVTSEHIHFYPVRNADSGGQEVDIVDVRTSRLRYRNVQRHESHGHVFCKVRRTGDDSDTGGETAMEEEEAGGQTGEFWEEYGQVSFRVAGL